MGRTRGLLEASEVKGLGGLPGEVGVAATEVTELGSLVVDGAAELELADDVEGAEVEVLLDDLGENIIGELAWSGRRGETQEGVAGYRTERGCCDSTAYDGPVP